MSLTEGMKQMIDWNDNAKAAVREFVECVDDGDYLSVSLFPLLDNFLESRPTQTKTVADAVECLQTWESEFDLLFWHESFGFIYRLYCDDLEGYQLVCTRAEFEAYVKEQEGEKWTHTYDNSNPRRLKIICDKPDVNGEIAVIVDGPKGEFYTKTLPSKIKPIKPTISNKEYKLLADYANYLNCTPVEFDQYISETYDVTN